MSNHELDNVSSDDNGNDDAATMPPRGGALAAVMCALPLLASWGFAAWLYQRLPASVPVHWDFAGKVDRYGGPLEAAFLLPAMLLFIAGVMLGALPKLMPAGAEFAPSRRVYTQIVAIVLWFMLYLQVVTSYMFLGVQVALLSWMALGAGVMFVLLGNLLPKLRRNAVAGVRLPWTLRDDTVWVKTQRMAGLSFVILGLVLIALWRLPGNLPLIALLAGKLVVVAAVFWYSWRLSQRAGMAG